MRYTFDEFDLSEKKGNLSRNAQHIPLNGQEFKTLLFLVRSAGEMMDRDAILKFAWSGASVEDNSVDKAVSHLRKVLGDTDKQNRRYIATITKSFGKRGYTFIHRHLYRIPEEAGNTPEGMPDSEWIGRINKIDDVKVYGLVDKLPQINLGGWYSIDNSYAAEVQKRARENDFDDCQAVITSEPHFSFLTHVRFNAEKLKYSAVSLLREKRENPFVLSANVVIICRDKRRLVLNHRSDKAQTFKGCLHTIGGAFSVASDNGCLMKTATREVFEEANVQLSIEESTPMLLSSEVSNRFIQLVFLGVNISVSKYGKLEKNWESKELVQVSFDDLESVLGNGLKYSEYGANPDVPWVPTGKAHVLAWLACGAPGIAVGDTFGGLTARQLFIKLTC